jgi:hypothetical protein
MKTRQELVLEFMLALASSGNDRFMKEQNFDGDIGYSLDTEWIRDAAEELAQKYLETL